MGYFAPRYFAPSYFDRYFLVEVAGGRLVLLEGTAPGVGTLLGRATRVWRVAPNPLEGAGTVVGGVYAVRGVAGGLAGVGSLAGAVRAIYGADGRLVGLGDAGGRILRVVGAAGSLRGVGELAGMLAGTGPILILSGTDLVYRFTVVEALWLPDLLRVLSALLTAPDLVTVGVVAPNLLSADALDAILLTTGHLEG